MIVYPNPIISTSEIAVGKEFVMHANPKNKALQPNDIVNVHMENDADPYGRAVVLVEIGNNTYRARRIE